MINPEKCMKTLTNSGDIPPDSVIASTNNKVVAISRKEAVVARISAAENTNHRDDPHDLTYSHKLSYGLSKAARVVPTLDMYPIISNGYLVSRYPLFESSVNLDKSDAEEIYDCMSVFADSVEAAKSSVSNLRKLNVSSYVQERIDTMLANPQPFDQRAVDYIATETERLQQQYPFEQLVRNQEALVHGDVKTDNFVRDAEGRIYLIDLDAVAVGPRAYDLASWRLRAEMGDAAPVEEVVEFGRKVPTWNEESYQALIGWKAVSSMSFTLRYEDSKVAEGKIHDIANAARLLGGAQSPVPVPESNQN